MKKYLIAIIILITYSCSHLKVKDELPDGYVVLEDKEINGFSISLAVGNENYIKLIPEFILEVGYDSSFIIVKQGFYDYSKEHIAETRYYIIPLINKISNFPDENKIGPLNQKEFKMERKRLNISNDLEFKYLYDEFLN